jgi:hypothetical protein
MRHRAHTQSGNYLDHGTYLALLVVRFGLIIA